MRIFTAVELPQEVRAALADAAEPLVDGLRGAKIVREDNLHVTLRFLGEVDEELVPLLIDELAPAAASVPRSSARMRGFGAFPGPRRPRVLWAAVHDPAGTLTSLEAAASAVLDPLGFPRKERPYHPHVTLVRLRRPPRRGDPSAERLEEALGAAPGEDGPDFGAIAVEHLTVFASELGRSGPTYTALARLALGASATT